MVSNAPCRVSRYPAVDLLALMLHRLPSLPDALCRAGEDELSNAR